MTDREQMSRLWQAMLYRQIAITPTTTPWQTGIDHTIESLVSRSADVEKAFVNSVRRVRAARETTARNVRTNVEATIAREQPTAVDSKDE